MIPSQGHGPASFWTRSGTEDPKPWSGEVVPGPSPRISVVIPTLNEASLIGPLLSDLRGLPVPAEVIVVDGGSTDGTSAIVGDAGVVCLQSPRGRGVQLRRGADLTRAPLLCFLHADVRLGETARHALARLAGTDPKGVAWVFRLRIDAPGWRFRMIETFANFRSRWLRLPYGDQGLIVTRDDYLRAGGFQPLPLMEDVALVRALRRFATLRLLDEEIRVSPRRWQREGALRRTLLNWLLVTRYLLGADPAVLARQYAPEGSDHG